MGDAGDVGRVVAPGVAVLDLVSNRRGGAGRCANEGRRKGLSIENFGGVLGLHGQFAPSVGHAHRVGILPALVLIGCRPCDGALDAACVSTGQGYLGIRLAVVHHREAIHRHGRDRRRVAAEVSDICPVLGLDYGLGRYGHRCAVTQSPSTEFHGGIVCLGCIRSDLHCVGQGIRGSDGIVVPRDS